MYEAFAAGDREAVERLLADDFRFSSPLDVDLDRAGYFERCWPGAGKTVEHFEIERLIDRGTEVLVTYSARRPDGTRFRNAEVFSLDDEGRIVEIEVYFGWELEGAKP
jgi:ketosteroid isomerase-like protein